MNELRKAASYLKARLELFAETLEAEARSSSQRRTARDFGQFADELIGLLERGEVPRVSRE